jgi:hypothetical protein
MTNLCANVYIDVVALSQGIVALLIGIPLLLVCEYGVFRLCWWDQSKWKTILICLYVNIVSVGAGYGIGGLIVLWSYDWFESLSKFELWLACFVCTVPIEWLAVRLFRRQFKIQKVFLPILYANITSYAALGIVGLMTHISTGN